MHEGKLSFLRSKQVSNFNLYKLGKKKGFGEMLMATKFEPTENWLPPGYLSLDQIETDQKKLEEDDRMLQAAIDADKVRKGYGFIGKLCAQIDNYQFNQSIVT